MNTPTDQKDTRLIPQGTFFPFIVLASCFAWWGLANNMTDPLVKAFTGIYEGMTNLESSLIQFAFYGAYFCLAVPGALIIRKFTYKTGVLVGLGVYILGCFLFYPAATSQSFYFFLFAFYILASGLSILETSANPYIISIGPEKTATQRLNLAQSFNPVGSIIGTLMAQAFILKRLEEAKAVGTTQSEQLNIVVLPYIGVGLFLLMVWLLIAFMRMPHPAGQAESMHTKIDFIPSVKALLGTANYVFAVVAQFFYVGAQICVWTFTVHYIPSQLGIPDSEALRYHTVAIILFGSFRFVCTGLMSYFQPSKLLLIMSVIAAGFSLCVMFVGGIVGVYALVGISACMSLMFPTIFGLGTRGLGEHTKLGGSGLIMAILGGALLPLVQGYLVDVQGPALSYAVPLVCFLVIAAYAAYAAKTSESEIAP